MSLCDTSSLGEHTDSDEGDSLCPNTHLDTAPLQQLTRPDLWCEDLEQYLHRMIQYASLGP